MKSGSTKHWLLAGAFLFAWVQPLLAEDLSDITLFYRCFAQLTQKQPTPDNPLLAQVLKGKDPITACLEVLDQAKLQQGSEAGDKTYRLADLDSHFGKDVLWTLHNLHASWFQIPDFPTNFPNPTNISVQRIYDTTAPALYFTRALFHSPTKFNSILVSPDNIVPIRTNDDPDPFLNTKKTEFAIRTDVFKFAPRGALIGLRATKPKVWPYSYLNFRKKEIQGQVTMDKHLGGGVIGLPAYILLNVDESDAFVADGAIEMPRKWARSLINDLMCRELPLIRPEDATPFVVKESSIEFRKAQGCVRCHATMDRMASGLRNLTFQTVSGNMNNTPPFGGAFVNLRNVTQPAESGWPAVSDPNYSVRPPSGTLYYRDYEGKLINTPFNNISDFAAKLAAQDDVYICAASRYYEYFTGIKVNVGDIKDESLNPELTKADLKHRAIVVRLGRKFKEHQNPRTLISQILRLPHYRQSDSGVLNTEEVDP